MLLHQHRQLVSKTLSRSDRKIWRDDANRPVRTVFPRALRRFTNPDHPRTRAAFASEEADLQN
jgi:hypothetical protein